MGSHQDLTNTRRRDEEERMKTGDGVGMMMLMMLTIDAGDGYGRGGMSFNAFGGQVCGLVGLWACRSALDPDHK